MKLKNLSLKQQLEQLLSLSYDSYAQMIEGRVVNLRSDPLRHLEASCLTDCVNQKELAFQIILQICEVFQLLNSSYTFFEITDRDTKDEIDRLLKMMTHTTDNHSDLYQEILDITDTFIINKGLSNLLNSISPLILLYTSLQPFQIL